MTVKAYAYSRYSSAAQASGDSLRRQLKSAIEFAEAQGVELDTTLQDRGVSAFTGANRVKGALGSFIARVQAGEIDSGSFLVLDSMDRLSRESETEVLHLLTGLTRAGIKVVDQAENLILDDKADSMAFIRVIINASRSHQESKEKGRKVKAAHGERKKRAREGIGWHKTGPSWLKSEAHGAKGDRHVTYSPIPERVAIVQRIFNMREAGLGSSVIAKMLNDDGVKPFRHASGWSNGVVYTMLGSRTVLGEYQPKNKIRNHRSKGLIPDGDPVAGLYGEPVIEPAQFHRVQAIMAKSAMTKGRKSNGQTVNNLFLCTGVQQGPR
jgi:DNA invertase Pin-like site-specific DNA recombinase